ncbi:MAG: ABC transporter permease [Bacteroidota bacterium]|jgi:uncharacterized protein (UPF0261 family)/ABC-type branched-subunit amino acid transport system ATPase component
MAWFARTRDRRGTGPILEIEKLDVYYGRAHALQEVSLALEHGVLAVVGRNGMGKTTLCNAVTGLLQGIGTVSGSVRLAGEDILGLPPNRITERGVGYVPQGRRVWPSLSVDEHLRLAARGHRGPWTVERVYQTFPRLAERKGNGGAELSGGEQQMLAIARALLFNPRLLVMDEPTEGLAPVIVRQVADMLKRLAADGEISVLLIEQNLGVAIEVADTVDVMVNGRIARSMPASELAADRELQQRLLGVRTAAEEENGETAAPEAPAAAADTDRGEVQVLTVRRSGDDAAAPLVSAPGEPRTVRGFTRWNAADPQDRPRDRLVEARAEPAAEPPSLAEAATALQDSGRDARVLEFPVAATTGRAAYVAGTFDTKGRELFYLRSCLEKLGLRTVTVDLSTSGKPSPAMVHPREVARHHPRGERAVFTGDRGTAVTEMAVAFEHFVARRRDLGGLISAGGSGGTALATQAMRRLPIGVPKVMVSSVASGDVRPYVGPSDICMMYSVTDVSGINRISERVLANAAHALAGMVAYSRAEAAQSESKPAIGLTMFGLTTPCVQAVTKQLEARYDCLVFHATGTGGQSMEKLVDSGLLAGVIDATTTEIADELVGGVLSAGPGRMDAMTRSRIPYVGSVGATDMVNFWAMDTVPERFRDRRLYRHNPNVTLMRTTPEEAARIGTFIVDKLNRMDGPVRFLIPEGGVSGIDAPDKPFWDPAADKALFDAIASRFRVGPNRQLVRLPHHINDPAFADALVAAFHEIADARAGVRALRV